MKNKVVGTDGRGGGGVRRGEREGAENPRVHLQATGGEGGGRSAGPGEDAR